MFFFAQPGKTKRITKAGNFPCLFLILINMTFFVKFLWYNERSEASKFNHKQP